LLLSFETILCLGLEVVEMESIAEIEHRFVIRSLCRKPITIYNLLSTNSVIRSLIIFR
jgi:hypothetical protein